MTASDMLAEIESLRADLRQSRDGERLMAGELEGERMIKKCWRTAAIVFFVGFAWQFVWNVVKWL